MDALGIRWCLLFSVVITAAADVSAAEFATRNFKISAASLEIAETIGLRSEELRRDIAVYWFGKPLPNWSRPCQMRVRTSSTGLGAGGQTTFQFVRGEVLNWNMSVQGSLERILDSVLPHEINHTIFACHFRRPLPRWADEGAATLFEHRSEQLKQVALLNDVIRKDHERISLPKLLNMKEYPAEMRPMLILYAQGYALADFLVQQKGRHAYLQFLADGDRLGWDEAIRRNFDHQGVAALEHNWKNWVIAGMPLLGFPTDQMLASVSETQATARPHVAAPAVAERAVAERAVAVPKQRVATPKPRTRPAPALLEPTGATTVTPVLPPGGSRDFPVNFGTPLLPGRRERDAGANPDWALFPGGALPGTTLLSTSLRPAD